jgi:hypothetical protein
MSRSCKYLIIFGFPTKILNAFLISLNIVHVGCMSSLESFSFPSNHNHHHRFHHRWNCYLVRLREMKLFLQIFCVTSLHILSSWLHRQSSFGIWSAVTLSKYYAVLWSSFWIVFLLSLPCYSRFVFNISVSYLRTQLECWSVAWYLLL